MKDNQVQEIIDYLEKGEGFTQLLIDELKRKDLEEYERKTYTGLVEALLGATELYESMKDEEDTVSIDMTDTTISEASGILNGMVLYSASPLYCEDKQIGTSISFHTNEQDEVSKFRSISLQYDGRLLISEEY